MSRTAYLPDALFDGDSLYTGRAVSVENGRILALDRVPGAELVRLPGLMAPGFIDLQVNGGGGVLFNTSPTPEAVAAIGAAHARFGTTAFLPTLISDDIDTLERAADAVAEALKQGVPGVIGVHFEGPHLSLAKRGVHPADRIRPLSAREWAVYERPDLGRKLITVAPETVAPDDIRRLVAADVRVCLGHSNADFACVQAALAAGATGFTHLFNAMSPFTSREPGMVGAALLDRNSWCGIIVDGVHVHDASLQLALAAKPRGKLILVTDAMPPVGLPDDGASFEFFGETVLRDGDVLRSPAGALAGSVLTMAGAVANSVRRLGLSREEALRMAGRYPAEFLGLDPERGWLRAGTVADWVMLDETLAVTATYAAGQRIA